MCESVEDTTDAMFFVGRGERVREVEVAVEVGSRRVGGEKGQLVLPALLCTTWAQCQNERRKREEIFIYLIGTAPTPQ